MCSACLKVEQVWNHKSTWRWRPSKGRVLSREKAHKENSHKGQRPRDANGCGGADEVNSKRERQQDTPNIDERLPWDSLALVPGATSRAFGQRKVS